MEISIHTIATLSRRIAWSARCSRTLLFVAVGLFTLTAAFAHDPFEMSADATLTSQKLEMRIVMPRATAFSLIEQDLPPKTRFDPDRLPSQLPLFEKNAGALFSISAGGQPLELRRSQATLTQEEDVQILNEYAPVTKSPLRIQALQLQKLGYGFGATVVVVDEANRFLGSKLLMGEDTVLEFPLAVNGSPPPSAEGGAPKPVFSFRTYLLLGIEHILTGYDHLLFLAALLVGCHRLRSILVIITCFTLAHSLTLALAAMNVVNLSPRIVEPLIAATIIYVAVENLFLRGREPRGRGWLTFTFGLIHGFGFASALRETGLGTDAASLALPLVSFNLGVEIGQITVAAVCLPLWWKARSISAVDKYGGLTVSCIVALAGLYWLLERTVL